MATSLPTLRLDQPCQLEWAALQGDDRVRFCIQCSLHVHNLSAMSEGEAAAFLASRGDRRVCVSYLRHRDGSAQFASATLDTNSAGVLSYAEPTTPDRKRWVAPLALAGALSVGAASVGLFRSTTTQVMGGIGASNPVALNVNALTPATLTSGIISDAKTLTAFDLFARKLVERLPPDVTLVGVRYDVYPTGLPVTSGRGYVMVSSDATSNETTVAAVAWMLAPGTVAGPNGPGGVRHSATLVENELFIECNDSSLAELIRVAAVDADAEAPTSYTRQYLAANRPSPATQPVTR